MAVPLGPLDVARIPMHTPTVSQSGWATKEDWIKHQSLIGQLYRKQTLGEIMDFMTSQHGFRATKKMYKTRIKQWGLDKKNKENEMRAIVRKKKQLEDQGKLVRFHLRGQSVDYRDVIRYWGRKGMRIEDVTAQRAGSKTPEAVDCFISLPSPSPTPEPMTNPERILISIHDYFRSSLENGIWLATDPRATCETTKDETNASRHLRALHEQSMAACTLFAKNKYQQAGQSLISATSAIKEILLAEHPMTLTVLLDTVIYIFRQRRYEIALSILRQFSALARILVGERHPLRYICGGLASICTSQFENVAINCSKSTIDRFEHLLGPMSFSTLLCRIIHIEEVDIGHDISNRILQMQDLLRRCEASLGPFDRRTCGVRVRLGWLYWQNRDHVRVGHLGWDVVAYTQFLQALADQVEFHTEGLLLVALFQYAVAETCSAEAYLRQSLDLRVTPLGPPDGQARNGLRVLERWLVRQNQLNFAAQVHQRWKEALQDSADRS